MYVQRPLLTKNLGFFHHQCPTLIHMCAKKKFNYGIQKKKHKIDCFFLKYRL